MTQNGYMAWVTPVSPWTPTISTTNKYNALNNLHAGTASDSDRFTYYMVQGLLEQQRKNPYMYLKITADPEYQSLAKFCPLLKRVEVIGRIVSDFIDEQVSSSVVHVTDVSPLSSALTLRIAREARKV